MRGEIVKKIKPRFVYDEDGNKVGITITVKEFESLIEGLEDFYDYQRLKDYDSKKAMEGAISIEEFEKEFFGKRLK